MPSPPFLFFQGIDSLGQIEIKLRQTAFAVRGYCQTHLVVPDVYVRVMFFFLSYLLLLINVLITAVMLRSEDTKNEARAKALYKYAWYILPPLTILGSAAVLGGFI